MNNGDLTHSYVELPEGMMDMIWVNDNDPTATEPWEFMVFIGKSSPFKRP